MIASGVHGGHGYSYNHGYGHGGHG